MVTSSILDARIAEIEKSIKDLQIELKALNKIKHYSAAKERLGEVSNRRSYERIFQEENIKSIISKKGGSASSREIYYQIVISNQSINQSTMRSYLTRMSNSGQLKYDKIRKRWNLL